VREPSEDLVTALESEVLGEASFRSAYYVLFNAEKKRKLKSLWALESETKRRLLAHYAANDIRLPGTAGLAVKASVIGLLMPLLPWGKLMETFLTETDKFLTVFRRLHDTAADEDKALFAFVVAHEEAIEAFALIESGQREGDPLAAIEALLAA